MKSVVLLALLLLPGAAQAQCSDSLAWAALRELQPKTYTFSEGISGYGLEHLYRPVHRGCDRPGCLVEHLEVPLPGLSMPADTASLLSLQAMLACLMAEWKKQQPPAEEP